MFRQVNNNLMGQLQRQSCCHIAQLLSHFNLISEVDLALQV